MGNPPSLDSSQWPLVATIGHFSPIVIADAVSIRFGLDFRIFATAFAKYFLSPVQTTVPRGATLPGSHYSWSPYSRSHYSFWIELLFLELPLHSRLFGHALLIRFNSLFWESRRFGPNLNTKLAQIFGSSHHSRSHYSWSYYSWSHYSHLLLSLSDRLNTERIPWWFVGGGPDVQHPRL